MAQRDGGNYTSIRHASNRKFTRETFSNASVGAFISYLLWRGTKGTLIHKIGYVVSAIAVIVGIFLPPWIHQACNDKQLMVDEALKWLEANGHIKRENNLLLMKK